jgi:hypothetical protein
MRMAITAFLVILCGVVPPAHAAPILAQPLQPALQGEFSNLGALNQQIADDFQLAAQTTLDSITWFGHYFQDTPVANPVNFSLRVFADDAGKPAVLPLHTVNVAVNAVPTGLTFGTIPWFSYSTPLAIVLNPGLYWISVLESDPATPAIAGSQWMWGDSTTAGQRASRLGDGVAWTADLDIDKAFTLTGTPVPEPSTLALSLLGAAIGIARRRRARENRPTCPPSPRLRRVSPEARSESTASGGGKVGLSGSRRP